MNTTFLHNEPGRAWLAYREAMSANTNSNDLEPELDDRYRKVEPGSGLSEGKTHDPSEEWRSSRPRSVVARWGMQFDLRHRDIRGKARRVLVSGVEHRHMPRRAECSPLACTEILNSPLRYASELPPLDSQVCNSEDAIRDVARAGRPIGLGELVESAELLTRVDRKYFVPAETFRVLIGELRRFRVLEIDGQRTFDYESVYFDTADLLTYRAHVQRRRRRFKARTRTYLDSGLCMFEVKTVGHRGNTVKNRIKHPLTDRAVLTAEAQTFLARTLDRTYGQAVPAGLRPTLINLYRRTTFASPIEGSRLTCDVSLSCHTERASMSDAGTHVLVESKSSNGAGEADRMLRRLGSRPTSVSKYCIGIAALCPELQSNPWRSTLVRYFDQPLRASLLAGPRVFHGLAGPAAGTTLVRSPEEASWNG